MRFAWKARTVAASAQVAVKSLHLFLDVYLTKATISRWTKIDLRSLMLFRFC